jgi:hypothetical protein
MTKIYKNIYKIEKVTKHGLLVKSFTVNSLDDFFILVYPDGSEIEEFIHKRISDDNGELYLNNHKLYFFPKGDENE